jgi:predicted ATPase/DNA-binding XRE family transcriptional regulator
MKRGAPGSFGAHLKVLREAAGFTQEELATIAGLSVQAIGALERGERRRPHLETVRALSAALDLNSDERSALIASARARAQEAAVDELSTASLPLPLTALIGRDRDVELLRQWLADPAARLITLLGPGGVGKTRLALEVARQAVEDDATRVVFVELASIRQATFVAAAIAEALGLSDTAAADLPRHVQTVCNQERPLLLVLDNCEHVLDVAPLVADLATSAPSLRVLATSRAALRVRGERLYAVEPLGLQAEADGMSPADLARVPAVHLFLDRVREVQPDFRLTFANAPTVTAICRRLDALPLAVELAAPWLKVLTPDDLLHRLERQAVLPSVGARDLPDRQQTMNATVAWSYQLLNADEQRAFRRFGVLPGLFPIDAAAAVLGGRHTTTEEGEALRAVAGLIDKSLLVRAQPSLVPTCPLYQMLETVRAFAALELARSGEREEACEGLARYCLSEASLAATGLVGPDQAEWLDRVGEDLESYRCALTWLIDQDRAAEAIHIAWSLLFFWFIRGRAAEGLRWYEPIGSLPSATPLIKSRARTGAAVMWYARGEPDRVGAELRMARGLTADVGVTDVVAVADLMGGHIERLAGNISAARERYAESLRAFQSLASAWGIGYALSAMGWLALAAGDEEEAERMVSKAASALCGACPWLGVLGLYIRAILAVRHRNPDAAIASVRESLTLIRRVRDKYAFVHIMVPLAAAAILRRDGAWAARILGAADAVAERTGARVVDGLALDLLRMVEREGRTGLGPDRWARGYASGRAASIDLLLKDIEAAST